MEIRPFREGEEETVIALWTTCGLVVPQNNPHRDIQLKLQIHPELFLVGLVDSQIVASLMAGYEGHRGWLNYLAVSPDHRSQGFGRQMVGFATERLIEMGCPKINLQIRSSNTQVIEFYKRIGFTVDEVISMGKRL
ncbi:GNAT family acetyltransferase [bacterium]|nr:MAG: GNAT family acetyltransferase [bacterium]